MATYRSSSRGRRSSTSGRGRASTSARTRTRPQSFRSTRTTIIRGGNGRRGPSGVAVAVGAGLAAIAAFLLFERESIAAPPPPPVTPPPPVPPPSLPGYPPGITPGQTSTAGQPTIYYTGPGTYDVIAPNGVILRDAPNPNGRRIQGVPQGANVTVTSDALGGWVRVTAVNGRPTSGYMCLSCPEGVTPGMPAPPPFFVKRP